MPYILSRASPSFHLFSSSFQTLFWKCILPLHLQQCLCNVVIYFLFLCSCCFFALAKLVLNIQWFSFQHESIIFKTHNIFSPNIVCIRLFFSCLCFSHKFVLHGVHNNPICVHFIYVCSIFNFFSICAFCNLYVFVFLVVCCLFFFKIFDLCFYILFYFV